MRISFRAIGAATLAASFVIVGFAFDLAAQEEEVCIPPSVVKKVTTCPKGITMGKSKKKAKTPLGKLLDLLVYAVVRIVAGGIFLLGIENTYRIAGLLTWLAEHVPIRAGRRTFFRAREHLKRSFPDWPADRIDRSGGFVGDIGSGGCAATETAACEHRLDLDFFRAEAERLRDRALIDGRHLRARPHLGT